MGSYQPPITKLAAISASVGGVVWVGIFVAAIDLLPVRVGLIEFVHALLLFAPLVVVPLGLRLVDVSAIGWPAIWWRSAICFQPVAAAFLIASFCFEQGPLATALAVPWILETGVIALVGVTRFLRRRDWLPLDDMAMDAGLVMIATAGFWLFCTRMGIDFDGHFEPIIVLLTAIHFHYVGFATGVLLSHIGRRIAPAKYGARQVFSAAVVAWIVGTMVVATGITAVRFFEFAGTVLLVTAFVMVVGLIGLELLPRADFSRAGRWCMALACASIVFSMAWAIYYSWGKWQGFETVSIPTMRRMHGAVNALGFAFAGLLGVTLFQFGRSGPRETPPETQPPTASASAAVGGE